MLWGTECMIKDVPCLCTSSIFEIIAKLIKVSPVLKARNTMY